jgi:hypothetical protein
VEAEKEVENILTEVEAILRRVARVARVIRVV